MGESYVSPKAKPKDLTLPDMPRAPFRNNVSQQELDTPHETSLESTMHPPSHASCRADLCSMGYLRR